MFRWSPSFLPSKGYFYIRIDQIPILALDHRLDLAHRVGGHFRQSFGIEDAEIISRHYSLGNSMREEKIVFYVVFFVIISGFDAAEHIAFCQHGNVHLQISFASSVFSVGQNRPSMKELMVRCFCMGHCKFKLTQDKIQNIWIFSEPSLHRLFGRPFWSDPREFHFEAYSLSAALSTSPFCPKTRRAVCWNQRRILRCNKGSSWRTFVM